MCPPPAPLRRARHPPCPQSRLVHTHTYSSSRSAREHDPRQLRVPCIAHRTCTLSRHVHVHVCTHNPQHIRATTETQSLHLACLPTAVPFCAPSPSPIPGRPARPSQEHQPTAFHGASRFGLGYANTVARGERLLNQSSIDRARELRGHFMFMLHWAKQWANQASLQMIAIHH